MSRADPGYSYTQASDIVRDGESLELWEGDTHVAEVFYSDQTCLMSFSAWKQDLPLKIVEELIEAAKSRLVPLK